MACCSKESLSWSFIRLQWSVNCTNITYRSSEILYLRGCNSRLNIFNCMTNDLLYFVVVFSHRWRHMYQILHAIINCWAKLATNTPRRCLEVSQQIDLSHNDVCWRSLAVSRKMSKVEVKNTGHLFNLGYVAPAKKNDFLLT